MMWVAWYSSFLANLTKIAFTPAPGSVAAGRAAIQHLLKDVEYIVRFFVDRGKFFNVVSERQWKRYLVENASGLRIFKPDAI
ncbi:hypothetical protein [Serratia ureilytica]|uniref:hypothetical protein n=1 Tax=Serratia ureilytica TaxID=300181 RepID=UPI001C120736|nr:hypothetical protein [Serratia ureilytica]MBU5413563.1 hypothetical protein [Serratia ureilytica]